MEPKTSREWASRLGLVTSPLFGAAHVQDNDCHTALLDGIAGSFVMSDYSAKNTPEPVSVTTGADWSWSCLMRHYVSVSGSDVTVIHSDRRTSDRFSKNSVE